VKLDSDEEKWKLFIAKHEMTRPQYRDEGFSGSLAKLFGVEAIATPSPSRPTAYCKANGVVSNSVRPGTW
jgi:hypothetical protein